jgi:hypothetical protein
VLLLNKASKIGILWDIRDFKWKSWVITSTQVIDTNSMNMIKFQRSLIWILKQYSRMLQIVEVTESWGNPQKFSTQFTRNLDMSIRLSTQKSNFVSKVFSASLQIWAKMTHAKIVIIFFAFMSTCKSFLWSLSLKS